MKFWDAVAILFGMVASAVFGAWVGGLVGLAACANRGENGITHPLLNEGVRFVCVIKEQT